MNIIQRPSSNYNDRKNGKRVSFLILHYTATYSAKEAEDFYIQNGTSPHYMIDEDGTITQHVPEDKRAWHAGVSYWNGEADLNSCSLGIELVNPGHEHGLKPFPALQMNSLITLCHNILERHAISPFHVLAHSDIAPARKQDPGELFDWQGLAGKNIGLWPAPDEKDYTTADMLLSEPSGPRQALISLGYTPEEEEQTLLTAFRRHFHPEALPLSGPDFETVARLCCLLRLQDEEKLEATG